MPVTIFEHSNFTGRSQELTEGQYDNALGQLTIPNDSLSSIKVSPGLVARLYADWLFRGEFIDINTDTPDMTLPWHDKASSIVVYKAGEQPIIKPYGPVMAINHFESPGPGVYGESKTWNGVRGVSQASHHAAVAGVNEVPAADPAGQPLFPGPGVLGVSEGVGVWGSSKTWVGVLGETEGTSGGAGVWGNNKNGVGVLGETQAQHGIGVMGKHNFGGTAIYAESPSGVGIHAKGGRLAGFFDGDVEVTGDIRLNNADCAEDFNIGAAAAVEPGTVLVLGHEGALIPSHRAYDKRVAGVVSGAGTYKPGIVLDKQKSAGLRQPIALLGKVFCKVDAQYGAVEVGDLLTTSATPGHAMKAGEPFKAFGTVIGKALRPLKEGQELIPILIALQ